MHIIFILFIYKQSANNEPFESIKYLTIRAANIANFVDNIRLNDSCEHLRFTEFTEDRQYRGTDGIASTSLLPYIA